jgi:hypothetical protein
MIDFRQRLRIMVSKWPGENGQMTDACQTDDGHASVNGQTNDGSRARNPNPKRRESEEKRSEGKGALSDDGHLAEPDFNALQETHARLDIILEYDKARAKLGKAPPLAYFQEWLKREEAKLIVGAPPNLSAVKIEFTPPTRAEVAAYAESRKFSRSFGYYCWKLWTGNGWKHYGAAITSDEQWQCLMETMEQPT